MMVETPFAVAATSTAPSELSPTAKRMVAPSPPRRSAVGVMPNRDARGLVETARRVEPSVVDRVGDGLRRAQPVGGAARPRLSRIGLRRHAGHFLEHAVEVVRAQARARGEVRQRGRLLGRCDLFAGAPHRLDPRIGRAEPVGPAALARAVARPLRLLGGGERTRRSHASPAARRSSAGNRRRSCERRRGTCRRRPGRGGLQLPTRRPRGGRAPAGRRHGAFRSWA